MSQFAMLETPPHISILASGPPAVPAQCGKLAMNSRAQLSRPILPAGWSLFFGGFAAAVLALGLYLLSAWARVAVPLSGGGASSPEGSLWCSCQDRAHNVPYVTLFPGGHPN